MRKGITPIISIIVLLLITVALAGVAWTYLSGFLGTQMQTITVPTNGARCVGGTISVIITNMGTETLTSSDIIQAEVAESDGTTHDLTPIPASLTSKATATLDTDCGGTGCADGSYTIYVGTAGNIIDVPVTC